MVHSVWLVRLRLYTGVILFIFLLTHFINHSLGIVSVELLERGQDIFQAFWRAPVIGLVVYVALVLHIGINLTRGFFRRTTAVTRYEKTQLTLGILIPFFFIPHVTGTRLLHELYGVQDGYVWILATDFPTNMILVIVFSVLVWSHVGLALNGLLSLQPWYAAKKNYLVALFVSVPLAGALGTVSAAFEYQRTSPAMTPEAFGVEDAGQMVANATALYETFVALWALLIVGLYVSRRIWLYLDKRKRNIKVHYPEGAVAEIHKGTTILEASFMANVAHASVCGGNGRCSTCRVRIEDGIEHVADPGNAEQLVLERISAPPNVRLACQVKPEQDVFVYPLLSANATAKEGFRSVGSHHGREQNVVTVFADLRGFTKFSEKRFPYDVVFILNQYFRMMGRCIEDSSGFLDKFIGDGTMALYGIGTENSDSKIAGQALLGARLMLEGLVKLNGTLSSDLTEPLRMGIGMHLGPVIVGEMGYGEAQALTAIGDTVNTASRLEGLTKEFGADLIVSETVADAFGLVLNDERKHNIVIRGKSETLTCYALNLNDMKSINLEPNS